MAEKYQRQPVRGMSEEELRRRRARARREQIRRKKKRIRMAVYAVLLIIIILIIVIVASCSARKKKASENINPGASEITIPEEYVDATFTKDAIEVSNAVPEVSDDGDTYSLYVNCALNVVTVYENTGNGGLNPVRAFVCSTGTKDSQTYEGTFILGEWYTEWVYAVDGTFVQYAYRVIDGEYNDVMFHSVPYISEDKSTLETEEYNKLGTNASAGCIRVCVADAIYIGTHCGYGTEVKIYSDPDEIIPIDTDVVYTIPANIEDLAGWDPTDPDSSNPWHNYSYTFEIPNSLNVKTGSSEAILEAVFHSSITAIDKYDNDISSYAVFSGVYNLDSSGKYLITAELSIGPVHAKKEVILIVSDDAETETGEASPIEG